MPSHVQDCCEGSGADLLVVVLLQLKLSIEESHDTNDGYAKGDGEKQLVEHLFFLVSDLSLGQTAKIYSSCDKPDWSENRPARSAGLDPLSGSRS